MNSAVQLTKQIIYVTGLPRAGSTLLCQLLGHHPQIYSTNHSSPLCEQYPAQIILLCGDTVDSNPHSGSNLVP